MPVRKTPLSGFFLSPGKYPINRINDGHRLRGEEQAVKELISLFSPHFSPPSLIFSAVSPSSLIFLFLPDQCF